MSELTSAELNILGLIAGVPSTSPPPVDLNDPGKPADAIIEAAIEPDTGPAPDNNDLLGATEVPAAQPVETVTEADGATSWRACTGPDVQAMVKAHAAGFVRTPGFSRDDVMTFLGSKGL